MSLYAGIDLNSNTVDVVLLDEDTMEARWIRYRIDTGHRGLDAFDRARRLRDAMPARTAWADGGVIAIGIEKPMARNPRGIIPQIRIQGALLACLPPDLSIYELVPATWKKLALGHGHATKTAGTLWAAQHIHWPQAREALEQPAEGETETAPDAEKGQLFDKSQYDREDLAIPKVDGEGIDKIRVKFSGSIMLDRSDPADVALFNKLTLGKECELRCAGTISGVGTSYATNSDGDLDAIVGQKTVNVETVWILDPEQL